MTARRLDVRPYVLQDYSLIADGERGAVIGPTGEIAWMCAPTWDSDSIFTSLIGGNGFYAIRPTGRFVWGGYYEADSLVWRSRWVTDNGVIECREALAFPGLPDKAVILRQVFAIEGDAQIDVHLEARANFGKAPMTDLRRNNDVWEMRTGPMHLRWQGGKSAHVTPERTNHALIAQMVVPEGTSHDFVLEISTGMLSDEPIDAKRAWQATERAWQEAIPKMENCVGPSATRHSHAVLCGLTSNSGGIVAAATTSLPERATEGRNYDYRYVWIRDQCFAGHAFAATEDVERLRRTVRFVSERLLEFGDQLAPAYRANGQTVPDQYNLDLPGYPGGFDCVGNWVNKQFQLDAFGESLLMFGEAAKFDLLDIDDWRAAEIAAKAIETRWTEPDAGIWELENREWTHSRLIAAAGLRAMGAHSSSALANGNYLALADRIVADTASRAVHRDGYWQRSPEDNAVDGSLLLASLRGAVPADDPRTIATLEVFQRDLVIDGYAYRFRHDDRSLDSAEGSFVLCGFLMSMALQQQGKLLEARAWWERTRASCGPTGLYSEEFDAIERQMRGNLPQAFVHAAMIESAAILC